MQYYIPRSLRKRASTIRCMSTNPSSANIMEDNIVCSINLVPSTNGNADAFKRGLKSAIVNTVLKFNLDVLTDPKAEYGYRLKVKGLCSDPFVDCDTPEIKSDVLGKLEQFLQNPIVSLKEGSVIAPSAIIPSVTPISAIAPPSVTQPPPPRTLAPPPPPPPRTSVSVSPIMPQQTAPPPKVSYAQTAKEASEEAKIRLRYLSATTAEECNVLKTTTISPIWITYIDKIESLAQKKTIIEKQKSVCLPFDENGPIAPVENEYLCNALRDSNNPAIALWTIQWAISIPSKTIDESIDKLPNQEMQRKYDNEMRNAKNAYGENYSKLKMKEAEIKQKYAPYMVKEIVSVTTKPKFSCLFTKKSTQ